LQINSNLRIIELKQNNINSLYSIATKHPGVGKFRRYLWYFIDTFCFISYSRIKKILEKEKPDIVHINGIRGFSSFVFSALKKAKIPHVITLHDYGLIYPWSEISIDENTDFHFSRLERFYMNYMKAKSSKINAVISPSQYMLDFTVKMGFFKNSKKHVVPNGLKLREHTKAKEGYGKEFVFLGRIDKNKGLHIAVEAFKKIKKNDIKLHIVGKGPYLETVKKTVQGDDRIIFHGYLEDDEINQIFERCSYGIIPSIWPEPFGLVINEFMNNGLPVIGSNIGAIPELIKDGHNGFLFNPGDTNSLQKIIEKVIPDGKILNELSKNAIESSKKFSIEGQLKSLLEIYNFLL